MHERAWRFLLGLALGLALGAVAPALAGISGGGGGGGNFTELATDTIDAQFSTTSTTFVAVTGLTASATANAGERWLVEYRITSRAGSSASGSSQLRVDGTAIWEPMMQEQVSQDMESQTHTVISQALSAGSRTVDVYGLTTSGTALWAANWFGPPPAAENCALRVYALR